jgi:pectate lyase
MTIFEINETDEIKYKNKNYIILDKNIGFDEIKINYNNKEVWIDIKDVKKTFENKLKENKKTAIKVKMKNRYLQKLINIKFKNINYIK